MQSVLLRKREKRKKKELFIKNERKENRGDGGRGEESWAAEFLLSN